MYLLVAAVVWGTYPVIRYLPVGCVTEVLWVLKQQKTRAKDPPSQTHQALCGKSELLLHNYSELFHSHTVYLDLTCWT